MYPEGALLVRQAKSLGLSSQWLGGDGIYVSAFIELAKEDAEGVYCTFIGADVRSMESARHYLETYTARFGQQRGPYSAYAYDAANIIIDAIRKAAKKTVLLSWLKYARPRISPGVVGLTSFDQKGDSSIKLIGVFQVRNQAFEYVGAAKE